jgi:Uncharacterised protein family (UPF0259)
MVKRVDVGQVLSRVFAIYTAQAATLLPAAFVVFLVVGVINGLLARTLILLPLTFAIGVIAGTLYQGMVVALVNDVQDGRRDYAVGDLFKAVTPVLVPLIVAGFLAGLGIGIGFILVIVPGLILATIWSVIGPAIVVERIGALDAFGRSSQLTKGHRWPVFGVIVITFIIVFVIDAIFGAIASAAGDAVIIRIIFNVLSSTITAPISALVGAVLYFALRGTDPTPGGLGTGAPGAPAPGFAEPAGTTAPPPPPPPPAPPAGPQGPGGPQSPAS